MRTFYKRMEIVFEKFSDFATFLLGNSITFILSLVIVVSWISRNFYYQQSMHETFRDIIHGFTFLSLFIIQKSFSRFTSSIHIKVNELVASNDNANNKVLTAETKTEHELNILTKEYSVIASQQIENEDIKEES